MNGATNGAAAPPAGDPAGNSAVVAAQSGEVLEWLERSLLWFVAGGDLLSARALLPILEGLSANRTALFESVVEEGEQASAAALVAGG